MNSFHAYRNSKCFKFLGGYCTIPELCHWQAPVCNPGKQATTGILPCRSTSLRCKTHALPRCLIRKTLLGLLRVLSGVPTCAHNCHPLTACSLLVCRKVTTPMWAQLCRPGCIRTFSLSLQRMAIRSFQALTHLTGILSTLSMAAAAL
jgi:hypothetical protein